ncbi:outer membrane beta-barrel protein [Pacificimonas sp. WHA3]|uniref:Outer membrane beta-barrel protein n=1 Tax=Pacificimonas pallii TaxID=2827236 RepID=A0ABS6SGC1_9SPHN|nr:outer membrane beta-barrel protein [Pacificimonas pallii]MBV7257391.1 outer membrane beta-barrel protein [Pacificimonas pallii]
MFKSSIIIVAAALAVPAAAQAKDADKAIPYVGLNAGWHQLEKFDGNDFGVNDDFAIDGLYYGAYAGVHVPVGESLIVGLEGNFNLGSSDIDKEYGLTAHIGTKIGENSLIFVRAGYQWIDLDLNNVAGEIGTALGFEGADRDDFIDGFNNGAGSADTVDDYLVGIGAEFGLGESAAFRLTADTVSFDTVRLGAGVSFRF